MRVPSAQMAGRKEAKEPGVRSVMARLGGRWSPREVEDQVGDDLSATIVPETTTAGRNRL
ncbi:MAG: hypothetical protein HY698_07355 [Deltaproteobacteria bacterium]|nr:hypothetical protein [Deltaproteobacteria bacterium]